MARRPKINRLVVVDLEATCWSGDPPEGEVSQITEIGICNLNLKTLEPSDKRSFLIMPQKPFTISPFCTDLTGITLERLEAEGMSLGKAAKIIKQDYGTLNRIWGGWGDYDFNMLERDCEAKGVPFPFSRFYRNIKRECAILAGDSRESGLGKMLDRLGMEFIGEPHRGDDDAWNEALVYASWLQHARGSDE